MEQTTEKRQKVHEIEQQECAEKIKAIEPTKIMLHPAGSFDKLTGFVYEPIGNKKYVWKLKGFKGLSDSILTETIRCPSCNTTLTYCGQKKMVQCSCGRKFLELNPKWKLKTDFANLDLEFEKEPLEKSIFAVPSQEAIDYWLKNYMVDSEGKEITEQHIFYALKNYFLTYFDFPFPEKESSILAIAAIQSWLIEILDTLFYVAVSGETGSGKTVLGEALMLVSKHGFMANSISSAGIARCIEGLKLSIFFDEIDNKKHEKDEDISGILRQGYRRNNFFVRLHPKTFVPETFNTFGSKAFSFRSEVIDDLANRSLEVTLSKTKNKTLPILNMFRKFNSPFNMLFFWYMDNITFLFSKHPSFIQELNELSGEKYNGVNTVNKVSIVKVSSSTDSSEDITKNRDMLIRNIVYLPYYANLIYLKDIFGRNIEISFLIYTLCQLLGIDLENVIMQLIEEKQETETASEEEGWIGILKDVLRQEYSKVFERPDMSFITYKYVIGKYAQKMREVYDIIPSTHQIKKMLRQIGFVDGLNKKIVKMEGRVMLALIYDSEIKKKIGIV